MSLKRLSFHVKINFEPGWISREHFNSYKNYTYTSNNICTTYLLHRHRLFTIISQFYETSSFIKKKKKQFHCLCNIQDTGKKIWNEYIKESFTDTLGIRNNKKKNNKIVEEDVLQKPLEAIIITNCSAVRVCSLKDMHSGYPLNYYECSEHIQSCEWHMISSVYRRTYTCRKLKQKNTFYSERWEL